MATTLRTLQPKRVTQPPDLKPDPTRLTKFQPKMEIERPKLDGSGLDSISVGNPPTETPEEAERREFERQQQQAQYDYALNTWLRDVADQLNTLPPVSTFSWGNPNSNVSGIPGTLGFNITSQATSKMWLKQYGSSNTGWASVLTGTVNEPLTLNGLFTKSLNSAPASGTASGGVGEITWAVGSGTTYLYVCVSANSWHRVALSPF